MRVYSLGLALLVLTAGCQADISYGGHAPDLSGRVTVDGVGTAGITIVGRVNGQDHKVQSGADGQYYFGQIPFGRVIVRAEGDFVVFPDTQEVNLDGHEVTVNFAGFGPVAASGSVRWAFSSNHYSGVSGVPVRIPTPFGLDAQTGADGSYAFPRAPGGRRSYPVVFGALPSGLTYANGDLAQFRVDHTPGGGPIQTVFVVYQPSASLSVAVLVDDRPYTGAAVHLNTPFPATATPGTYNNLPVMPLTVSIDGFPSSISFDATSKPVQLLANGSASVTFVGYTAGANRRPTVSLIAPANGARFTAGTPITFRGTAQDLEDGNLTGNSLDWIIGGVGTLGHGESLTVDTLRVGQHRVEFRATDSGGSIAFTVVDVTVVPATGGRVVGTVTSNGSPLVGARVDLLTLPGRFVTTNQQGAYAFEDVPAGGHVLGVQPVACVEFPITSLGINVAVGVKTTVNFAGTPTSYCYTGYVPGRGF